MFKSNISFAEEQLLSYLHKTGKYYEANRNYSEDRSNNNTTSLLSPFIRYRLISEERVLEEVLKKYDLRCVLSKCKVKKKICFIFSVSRKKLYQPNDLRKF